MKDGKLEPEEMDGAFMYARLVVAECDEAGVDLVKLLLLSRALIETSELCLMTRCVYCGHTLRWDSIAQRRERGPIDLAEHVIACEKRPELRLMAQVAAAEGELQLARAVIASVRNVHGYNDLTAALARYDEYEETPILIRQAGQLYHCNICGGDVDLSNASAPTVKWGGHQHGKTGA